MANSIQPSGSIRPALAQYVQTARLNSAEPLHDQADRFEADLKTYAGESLEEIRGSATAAATSEGALARGCKRKGWLVGAAAAATWVAVPLVGTLVSAPIFMCSYGKFKAAKQHRQAAEEAGWFLHQLDAATSRERTLSAD